MPELPEVETTRRGIEPHVLGKMIVDVVVRNPRLRVPVSKTLARTLRGQSIRTVSRRGKYLLLRFPTGTLILHLGMSGSLRIVHRGTPPRPHDHLDLVFDTDKALRLHDPRRFGLAVWTCDDPFVHPLLAGLGPEPLGDAFDGTWLYGRSRGRRISIKQFIMDGHVVVGVGNIYASESLFRAGIRPLRAAGRLTRAECARLAAAIRDVLAAAIAQGGTTLRDFVREDGAPGYFSPHLDVYGRDDQPCHRCGTAIRRAITGGRTAWWCPRCQR